MSILGIHHITALASDPQRSVDFYAGFLGLRLVKQTVNFDAPDVYHLYYGDEAGHPGTILTFFPFLDAARGKRGVGEISAVAFSIPSQSLNFWVDRLAGNAVHFDGPVRRFNDDVVSFEDPDGMLVELVPNAAVESIAAWKGSTVDQHHAIRRIHSVTLTELNLQVTSTFLKDMLGFEVRESGGSRYRYMVGDGIAEAMVDVVVAENAPQARQSAGSVHHIAWRVADDQEQLVWRERLASSGYGVTQVLDRYYFRSIYFREPGGILFEIATDPPGFLIDEPVSELGSHLKLPPWMESQRSTIERMLPPLRVPVPGNSVLQQ